MVNKLKFVTEWPKAEKKNNKYHQHPSRTYSENGERERSAWSMLNIFRNQPENELVDFS